MASLYSFADLGSSKLPGMPVASQGSLGFDTAAATAAAAAAAAASAAGSSALGALQARLQAGSLGSFGSMLGDTAAEMTAMAQQRFGDIGLGGLGSGILSSLTKGVGPLGGRTTGTGK
jgi:conserved oligomeric Golgi complex subunit 1